MMKNVLLKNLKNIVMVCIVFAFAVHTSCNVTDKTSFLSGNIALAAEFDDISVTMNSLPKPVVEDVVFTEGSNKTLDTTLPIAPGTKVNATLILNNTSSSMSISVIMALFKGDGRLDKINVEKRTLDTVTEKAIPVTVAIDVPSEIDDYKIKVFLLDSNGNLIYYPEKKQFPNIDPKNYCIVWDQNSQVKISHNVDNAEYGRMCFVTDKIWLTTYTFGPYEGKGDGWSSIAVRRSADGGVTWGEPFIIPRPTNGWRVCFSELIKLSSGRILLAYTYNPNPQTNEECAFYVRYSDDNGETWSEESITAAHGRGWEPSMIQLEDGTIQMFYSSEARWWNGPGSNNSKINQEILMVESKDDGLTWNYDTPKRVAYNLNKRDGMPVPILLKNNKGAAFVIESVGNARSPFVIWTPDAANWQLVSDNATGPSEKYRWLATTEPIFGGAPYITQLPNGITIMSCQAKGYKKTVSSWRKNVTMVYIGDDQAQNFTNRSYPWPSLAEEEGTIQNAIYALDDTRILLVSTFVKTDGKSEIRYKIGRVANSKK